MTAAGERGQVAPEGYFGGLAGGLFECRIVSPDGAERTMPSKGATEIVHLGDRVHLQPAGSGGYGNPKERSVASIEADLLDGYITLQAARTLYGYQGSTK